VYERERERRGGAYQSDGMHGEDEPREREREGREEKEMLAETERGADSA
jgi:hypothetical protein